MGDPLNTPMLMSLGVPYFPFYFGACFVPWRPLLIGLVISPWRPFLYSVVHSSVLFVAPNALGMPMQRIFASRLACSMYCSILIMASIVDTPSL